MSDAFEWKTSFASDIFRLKYAQGPNDTWPKLARRLVEDVCGTRWGTEHKLMSDGDRAELVQMITNQEFIPGGRYLYYAGREVHFYNNCLSGDTRILTDQGWKRLDEAVDTEVNLRSPVSGEYLPAKIYQHGKQKLQKITFASHRGTSKKTYTVRATRTHHWPLADGTDTYDLRVGDVVPANSWCGVTGLGILHGYVFGDGTKEYVTKDGKNNYKLRLCSDKDKDSLLDIVQTAKDHNIKCKVFYPDSANGDPVVRFYGLDSEWKKLPDNVSTDYVAGFLCGWIFADGCEASNSISSVQEEAVDYFIEHAPFAGLVVSGVKRSQIRDTEYKTNSTIWTVNFRSGSDWSGFKVISIEPDGEETVYCPYEPKYERFVIENGIDTFNCFCLKGEEDTREEWGRLAKAASDCLMSGGGIGVDYSIFRPSGRALRRTGGTASGPIPLMYSINEIGRNVMQGGSRRSAIFASLNWQHGDVNEFLRAKDWTEEQRQLKEKDFNFPLPLDMTNISINWDTDFIERYMGNHTIKAGTYSRVPDIWYESVRRMCKTGEPGHCYNFWENENDTLRNACTEFTSEDDSDVCNLGSVNLGNIDTIERFNDVVSLASKFLVCGTIRGDVPYQKVKEVRDKNRKIGLGLMGIHEWLLKRGCPYGMNEELKSWLGVYKDASTRSADEHCERFYISNPKKYRAIAPAGTIGILASTTTGIEPLFAVAYKRRYLEGGTKWRYQYVVDATAKRLINEYDLDPDTIETSYSLATDPEKRIVFQADIQDYVDMGISSTLNLPAWGSEHNNEDTYPKLAETIAQYCHRLRGLTVYPDGARGGQPFTPVSYDDAISREGVVFDEFEEKCSNGVCGV